MTYTEEQAQFFQELYTALDKELKPEGAILQEIEVPKNNTIKQGITVQFEDQIIGATIYPENFYQDFLRGVSLEDIVFHLKDELTSQNQITAENIREMNHDNATHYLKTAVVSYKGNEDWLKDTPHERVADLAVYGKWDFGNGYSAKVTDQLLTHLKMTKEEMIKTAKGNMAMQSRLQTSGDALVSQMIQNGMPEEEAAELKKALPDNQFLVLTVNGGTDGAALIADSSVMKKVSRDIGEDYYILPSSVHEALILPKSKCDMDIEELKHMVHDINQQEVSIEERLSDNVYEFNGRSLVLAGQTETMDREMPALDLGIHHKR